MSVTGFLVDGQIQKYDYNSLDNLPDIPENSGVFWATYNSTSEAEITSAFSNNKSVMMKYGNDVFLVTRKLGIGPSGSAWLFTSVGQTDIRTTWVSGSYWNTFSTNSIGGDISNNLKQALLQLASKVVYVDEYGQTYYNDLYNALYPKELISISATFNQGSNIIYDIDPLMVLNQYLTVVANYSDGTTETIPSSDYTLSGNLLEGVSTITVYYEGFTDTFNVNVTHMAGYYTIVNNLTGCTTNNSATAIQENTSYTAIITASAGYTLSGATATITMGGNILTGVFSNGTISIPSVTGDLVITVVASAVTLSSITAVYTQSGTVYDTDTLDSLKTDLVVTATYSDSSTQTVTAADYTLSGTLTVGTSTITVSYGGKTATFNVAVTKYWDFEWDYTMGSPENNGFIVTVSSSGGSAVMTDDYYAMTSGTASGTFVKKTPDFTDADGIIEAEILFPSVPPANSDGFSFTGPKWRYVCNGGKFYLIQTGSELLVYSNVIANTWYKLRTEYTASGGCKFYINNELINDYSSPLNGNFERFIINSAKNSGTVYIRSMRARAL